MTASRLDILNRLQFEHGDTYDWSEVYDLMMNAGLVVDIPHPGDDPLDRICSLCHIKASTGSCNHLLDLGDGRVGMSRSEWESFLQDRFRLRDLVDAAGTDTTPPGDEDEHTVTVTQINVTEAIGDLLPKPDRWFGEWRDRPTGYDQWRTRSAHDWATGAIGDEPVFPDAIVEARPVPQPTPRWTVGIASLTPGYHRVEGPRTGWHVLAPTSIAEDIAAALNAAHGKETDQ